MPMKSPASAARIAALAVLAALFAALRPLPAAAQSSPSSAPIAPSPWADVEIGAPPAPGGHAVVAGAFTVSGSGAGIGWDKDQGHYVYRTVTGDVEVVARITAFSGPENAQVGIMLRSGDAPDADRAAVIVAVNGADQTAAGMPYRVFHAVRDAGQVNGRKQNGYSTTIQAPQTAKPAPIWIKFIRMGNDYGVYKSPDGKIWSVVHNDSGGPFKDTGPCRIGFFVASGDAKSTKTVTAAIDNIHIGRPVLGYHTSWLGNTYSQDSTDYVSGTIGGLYVAPDGACYTDSYWDEGGEAAKIYKDGRVVKAMDNAPFGGNDGCGEGTVTGDGSHIYAVSSHYIYRTDLMGDRDSSVPLFSATDLWDDKRNINVTSGMAVAGGLLYVSDFRDNKILVFDTGSGNFYYRVRNSTTNIAGQAVDSSGVANAAPAAVYQSQRECDWLWYVLPGLKAEATCTVRLHFAEYKYDQPGKRLMDISAGGQTVQGFDIVKVAGGSYRAAVLDIPGAVTDKTGALSLSFTANQSSPDRHIVVCGIEVIGADGKDALAINCGGPAVGGFQSEVSELPDKEFAFDRPGPMAVDQRGDLWIIHEASDFHGPDPAPAAHENGSVVCVHLPGGAPTGRWITDVAEPTAVAYDPATDRLLVTDNGTGQNIRLYANLSTAPKLDATFGARGGIFSGDVSGRLYDPAAGGWARFYAPNAVGVDSQGNIYVNCSGCGTDLRKYSPDGRLLWKLQALHFCDCGDFDPASDGTVVYNPFKMYAMDYSKAAPGSEWTFTGYNWNAARYGPPPRQGSSSCIVRRLGPGRALIMYTSGQGAAGYVDIFRFEGDLAIPCARISEQGATYKIWTDRNGDGIETPDEDDTSVPRKFGLESFHVDQRADIWLVGGGVTPMIGHFVFKGLNAVGAPIYDGAAGDHEDIAYPPTTLPTSTWGQLERIVYDSDRDIMYLMGPANIRKSDKDDTMSYIAAYPKWSRGNRKAAWLTQLPDPTNDPNFMYVGSLPYGLAYQYEAFDVAGDYVFVAELWGPIHVYDARTGKYLTTFNNGPEVSGCDAWEDENMGIRATERSNGEYVVMEENSGFRAKDNLFRWKPAKGQ